MNSPNILITNYCNQGCTYCFASSLMKDVKIPKEMTLSNFKLLVHKLKQSKNNIDTIKLLGGEPTLHSQFEEMVTYALENFAFVHLFTNGFFSGRTFTFLKKNVSRLRFTFNIMTPSFLGSKKAREAIIEKITVLGKSTEAALSITADPTLDVDATLKNIDIDLIRQTKNIRIGASNPLMKKVNFYHVADFQKIGDAVYKLALNLKKINPNLNIHLDCGFVPCMFDTKQLKFLKQNNSDKTYWGCYLGNMDIQTDTKAIVCYPLSSEVKVSTKINSIDKIEKKFILDQYVNLNRYQHHMCKKCHKFGFQKNMCSGPCIAFLANLKNSSSSKT